MYESAKFNNLNTIKNFSISAKHLFFDEIQIIHGIKHYILTDGSIFISFIYTGNKEVDINNIINFINNEKEYFIVHKQNNTPAIYSKNKKKLFEFYLKFGYLHRENDLPAIIDDKIQYWYNHGFLHRKFAPSFIEFTYNHDENFQFNIFGDTVTEDELENLQEKEETVIINDIEHIKYTNSIGHTIYFLNNKIHREDNKPAFISKTLNIWYNHGIIHRQFKPAIIENGYSKIYLKNGKKLKNEEIKKEIISGNINFF